MIMSSKYSITEFIEKYFLHFNAASLVDAAKEYENQINNGSKMLVSLAGAMSTAELGKIFSEVIRKDKVIIPRSDFVFEKDDLGSLTEVGAWHLNHSKHRVKAGLTYDNGRKWNLGLSYKYDGGFEASMGSFYSGTVESRNVYDANLGYDINSKTKLSMNIVNLTDETYSFLPNLPLLGRQVMFSLKRDF